MSVYTLRAIRATPEPTIESFFYSLQEILVDNFCFSQTISPERLRTFLDRCGSARIISII